MSTISLRVDGLDDVRRALKQLGAKVHTRIVTSALARAGKAMDTHADRAVRAKLNLKRADTKGVIKLRRPSKTIPEATLFVSHKAIRLAHYGARTTRRGVTVKVLRGGPRKVVQRAFILTHKSGKRVILQREGTERLPIKPLYGREPYQVISQGKLEPKIAARGAEVFVARFAHEWKREVAKIAARART
jgi:hypothetical protein